MEMTRGFVNLEQKGDCGIVRVTVFGIADLWKEGMAKKFKAKKWKSSDLIL